MDFRILLISLLFHTFIFTPLRAQWTSLGSGVESSGHRIFNISVVSPDIVWGISSDYPDLNDHLVRTTDGGETLTAFPFAIDSNLYAISLHAVDEMTAWLATADEQNPISGKVYKTTDGGSSWQEQVGAFTAFNETPAGIYFWDEDNGVAFGATCDTEYEDQIAIYYTENGGNDWTAVSGDAMPDQLPEERMCLAGGNGYYEVVGDTIWFATYRHRVYRSVDRGKNWEAFYVHPAGIPGVLTSIAFKDARNGVAVIYPRGSSFTTDGGETWSSYQAFPFTYEVAQVEYIPGTEGTYIAGNGSLQVQSRLCVTHDGGSSWEGPWVNENTDCFQFLSPSVGYGGGIVTGPDSGGIYKWEGDLLTNILEPEAYTRMSVFPNPAVSTVQVSLPDWPAEGLFVRLVNAQGQSVQERWVKEQDEINVASLRPGLYSLMATADGQTYVGQFIKL